MFEFPSKKDVKRLNVTLDYARDKFEKSDLKLKFEFKDQVESFNFSS